jgi:polysaccharide export outer membrane protein
MGKRAVLAPVLLLICLGCVVRAETPKKPVNLTPPLVFGEGEYRVGPEDVLEVFVWREPELTATVVVRPDGKISLPLISELDASGKTAAQLQQEVRAGLRQYLEDPVVSVIVKEVNSPKLSVLGQVRKPDRYRIKQRITVLEAIAMAGGFTDFAKRDKVVVIRNHGREAQRIVLDLGKALKNDRFGEFYLEPFDTLYVE